MPSLLDQVQPAGLPFSPQGWIQALQEAISGFVSRATQGDLARLKHFLQPAPQRAGKSRKPGIIPRPSRRVQKGRVKARRAELRRRTAQRVQQKQRA